MCVSYIIYIYIYCDSLLILLIDGKFMRNYIDCRIWFARVFHVILFAAKLIHTFDLCVGFLIYLKCWASQYGNRPEHEMWPTKIMAVSVAKG